MDIGGYEGGLENIITHKNKYSQAEFENIIAQASVKAFSNNIDAFHDKIDVAVKYITYSNINEFILQVLIDNFGFKTISLKAEVMPYELSYIQISSTKLEDTESLKLDEEDIEDNNEPILIKIGNAIRNFINE